MEENKNETYLSESTNLISDEQVRSILHRFLPILQESIQSAGTFNTWSTRDRYDQAVFMTEEERQLWNRIVGLESNILKEVEKKSLFVPDFSTQPQISSQDALHNQRKIGKKTCKVELDNDIYIPVLPFTSTGMKLLIQPKIHIEGERNRDRLFHAIISIDTYVQDQQGRFAVKWKKTERNGLWDSTDVYAIYHPKFVSLWFNTLLDITEQNSLKIEHDFEGALMLSSKIHQPDLLNMLSIPTDLRLRLFFWQINRFLSPESYMNNLQSPLLLT